MNRNHLFRLIFRIIFRLLGGTLSLGIVVLWPVFAQGEILLNEGDVIARSLEQNYGIRRSKLAASRSLESLREFDARYDTELFGNATGSIDSLERSSNFLGTDIHNFTYGLGVRKHIPLGTDIQFSWREERIDNQGSQFATINPSHESVFEVQIRQPILYNAFGLIDRGERKVLQNNTNRQRNEFTTQIENTLASVLRLYWVAVLNDRTVEIRKESLKQAEILLGIQKRKRRIGLVEDPDFLDTQVTVKINENDLINAENNLVNSTERLRTALAYPQEESLKTLDKIELPEAPPNLEDEIKLAFESRRDLQQIQDDMKANEIAIRIAKNSKLPRLDFVATLQSNGVEPDQVDAIIRSTQFEGTSWAIGGEITYPLENRRGKAATHRALIDRTSLILQRKQIEDQIIEEVGIAVRDVNLHFDESKRRMEISQLQRQKFKAQRRKFQQGRSSSDLVNRFLRDALIAELNVSVSVIEYHLARIELRRQQNRLLSQIDIDDEARRIFR